MRKIILSIILFFMLSSCGYSPILIQDIQNFDLKVETVEGDNFINNLILSKLNRVRNDQSEDKVTINIYTKYDKVINSKDATGATASYELYVTSTFNINRKNINKKIVINEKFIMDKFDNKFDEDSYERTIKKTFASSIVQKIILKINSIK
jgi:hypothetical protein